MSCESNPALKENLPHVYVNHLVCIKSFYLQLYVIIMFVMYSMYGTFSTMVEYSYDILHISEPLQKASSRGTTICTLHIQEAKVGEFLL